MLFSDVNAIALAIKGRMAMLKVMVSLMPIATPPATSNARISHTTPPSMLPPSETTVRRLTPREFDRAFGRR